MFDVFTYCMGLYTPIPSVQYGRIRLVYICFYEDMEKSASAWAVVEIFSSVLSALRGLLILSANDLHRVPGQVFTSIAHPTGDDVGKATGLGHGLRLPDDPNVYLRSSDR